MRHKIPAFIQSLLSAISVCWLFLEAQNALEKTKPWHISFQTLVISGILLGLIWYLVNGYFIQGYLKSSITIKSNAIQSDINIYFDDIFKQAGFKAIAVNDFFDSIVDDRHISSNSLHGKMLKLYWPANVSDWDKQVSDQLSNTPVIEHVDRPLNAKVNRYKIGASIVAKIGNDKFLCTALSKTNIENLECSTTPQEFHNAIHEMLRKARSVCSGEQLNIPLMGSGLSRTGIKGNILVDIILLGIFCESKIGKITDTINIVLPKDKKNEINLNNILVDWS